MIGVREMFHRGQVKMPEVNISEVNISEGKNARGLNARRKHVSLYRID